MLQGTVVHEAQKCGGMNTQAWHMQQQVNFFFSCGGALKYIIAILHRSTSEINGL